MRGVWGVLFVAASALVSAGQAPAGGGGVLFEGERLWLLATVRHLKMEAVKLEIEHLTQQFSSGMPSEEFGVRYRELTARQDQLRKEAEADLSPR